MPTTRTRPLMHRLFQVPQIKARYRHHLKTITEEDRLGKNRPAGRWLLGVDLETRSKKMSASTARLTPSKKDRSRTARTDAHQARPQAVHHRPPRVC